MSLFSKAELEAFKQDVRNNYPNVGKNELELITRNEFKEWLKDLGSELRDQIKKDSLLDPAKKEERKARSRQDFGYFAKTYFPHYFTIGGECLLHEELSSDFVKFINSQKGSKNAYAAPRGHAKTTYSSKIFPIWLIAFGFKKFIVEISDAVELVEGNLEAVKVELEDNPNLQADFPEICGVSKNWKVGEFVTKNGVKLKAFGSGKRLRGVSYGAYRPDVVIIDDLENDTNVRSKDQRDKLQDWIDEAVLNLGSVDGSLLVVYIGTVLHSDSVLARKLKLSYWNAKRFASIVQFPDRMDLWDEYCEIYKKEGLEAATKFYHLQKETMDFGSIVLWKEALPIDALMRKRAENLRAFNKEQMNAPLSEQQKFTLDKIKYYHGEPRTDYRVMYVDPAGNGKKSDFTAITVLGANKGERRCYILKSVVKNLGAKAIIKTVLELQIQFKCRLVAIETNGGQFFLKAWLLESAFDKNVYLPLRGVNNHKNKGERIETLELPIENEELLFGNDTGLLIEQLIEYPEGKHDDAPDSLAGAYSLIKRGGIKRDRIKTHRVKHKIWSE
ncbi:phage terminase large subunit [Campylobacter fetus]|uniref:phage terminase large subunit n=1 Tax=Campylobacter fetus TaxID=196 RepID=UPI00138DF177|nr:phage terminase large subunit [Campylobacter fetus]